MNCENSRLKLYWAFLCVEDPMFDWKRSDMENTQKINACVLV